MGLNFLGSQSESTQSTVNTDASRALSSGIQATNSGVTQTTAENITNTFDSNPDVLAALGNIAETGFSALAGSFQRSQPAPLGGGPGAQFKPENQVFGVPQNVLVFGGLGLLGLLIFLMRKK